MVRPMLEPEGGGPRIFSIEEANAIVPKLQELVRQQLDLGDEIERLVTQVFAKLTPRPPGPGTEVIDITVYPGDSADVRKLKQQLAQHVERYRDGWSEVEQLGVVVKDPRSGLLDLYGRIDDRLVWLCWQYGERGIDHYHELDAGFAERKPLAEVRQRMLN